LVRITHGRKRIRIGGTDPTGVASIGIVCGFVETIDGTIYRFAYHGLMKNKHGMKILDGIHVAGLRCGSDRGVIFETGFRRRDPIYDGGDAYYEPR
jgi:hypothetical protein